MACRRMGRARWRAACLLVLAVMGCSARSSAPSRTPEHATRPAKPKPVARPAEEKIVEPDVCRYDDYYEDQSFFVSVEPVESLRGSRFFGREQALCGDRTLVLDTDEKGATLT